MINNIKIEICLGNIQDVEVLNKYPIDRIELNSALELGGLSPSLNTLIETKRRTDIKVITMVRCRGGNFCYKDEEYEVMFKDAKNFLDNGADGLVFGFLNEDLSINIDKTKKMVDLIHSYNKEAVFHKAYDCLLDLDEGTRILRNLKVDRILTSGKSEYPYIIEGCKTINSLHNKYPDIELLPGGGVRVENIKDVIKVANTNQVHMTSKKTYDGYLGLDEEQLIKLLKEIESI